MRDSLKAFAKTEQENGRQYFRMAELLFGHDGSALTLGDCFENLAEVENVNRSRAAKIKVSRSEIGSLLRASPLQRLYEVLVPAD